MDKPKYDTIRGLSPTIAIEQKSASNNPRSTVGTITEVHDYLRVLYARAGVQHCHECGRRVGAQTAGADRVASCSSCPKGTKVRAPRAAGAHARASTATCCATRSARLLARAHRRAQGRSLRRARRSSTRSRKHDIDVVIDRIVAQEVRARARLTDSVEARAARKARACSSRRLDDGRARVFSSETRATRCGLSFRELSPQSFSFNTPLGMCTDVQRLGTRPEMDPDLVVAASRAFDPRRRDRAVGRGDGARRGLDGRSGRVGRASLDRTCVSTSQAVERSCSTQGRATRFSSGHRSGRDEMLGGPVSRCSCAASSSDERGDARLLHEVSLATSPATRATASGCGPRASP